jgi:hypothetical protein
MIPLPYMLGALVAVFILGCANGYAIRDGAAKTAAAKSYKAAEGQRLVMQGQIDVISAKYEELKETTNRKYVERTNTIREFYGKGPAVDPNCALADPMFRLLSDNVRDANAAVTGELGSDMSNPTTTTKPRN